MPINRTPIVKPVPAPGLGRGKTTQAAPEGAAGGVPPTGPNPAAPASNQGQSPELVSHPTKTPVSTRVVRPGDGSTQAEEATRVEGSIDQVIHRLTWDDGDETETEEAATAIRPAQSSAKGATTS